MGRAQHERPRPRRQPRGGCAPPMARPPAADYPDRMPLQDAIPTSVPAIEVSAWALATFILYLLLLVGIGFASARVSSAGLSEFFLGGRRMNRLVVALSAVVSGR